MWEIKADCKLKGLLEVVKTDLEIRQTNGQRGSIYNEISYLFLKLLSISFMKHLDLIELLIFWCSIHIKKLQKTWENCTTFLSVTTPTSRHFNAALENKILSNLYRPQSVCNLLSESILKKKVSLNCFQHYIILHSFFLHTARNLTQISCILIA